MRTFSLHVEKEVIAGGNLMFQAQLSDFNYLSHKKWQSHHGVVFDSDVSEGAVKV